MDKKWTTDGVPLEESNCAGIGSDEDKALRKIAAQTEPAWNGAGAKPGTQIWRIENFKVVPWPQNEYGQFYSGDSYIIMSTVELVNGSGELSHQIYFWLGEKTTTDEMGTAAYKTVELSDLFDGEPTQHREVMGKESQQFKALFQKITYLQGGVESGFHSIAPDAYKPRLIQVRKIGKEVVSKEVTLSRDSMNQGDSFVLDAGTVIYVWSGRRASPFEKHEAGVFARQLENRRGGHAKVTHDTDKRFWELLGGEGEIKSAAEGTDCIAKPAVGDGVLFKLSDETGQLVATEVGAGTLSASMLSSDDVMMLDRGTEICLWVGKGASTVESRNAYRTAMRYLQVNEKDQKLPIHMYKEGQMIRDPAWKKTFGGC